MTQFDAAATPMLNAFDHEPNRTPIPRSCPRSPRRR
jgi:hypothetical protein